MISPEQLTQIGQFGKPHGIKGELSAAIDPDVDPAELSCIVLDMDGIFVPFFITGIRTKGSETYLLTIEGIENESQAAEFVNKTIYALTEELDDDGYEDEDGFYLESVIGYTLQDPAGKMIGLIEDVDFSSENLLLIVRPEGADRTIYIPVAEDLIQGVDSERHILTLEIAEGLLELL